MTTDHEIITRSRLAIRMASGTIIHLIEYCRNDHGYGTLELDGKEFVVIPDIFMFFQKLESR